MSTLASASSTPKNTPPRPRNSPRPLPSPLERTFSPSPSTTSTLSAAAGAGAGMGTPRRASTPLVPGPLSPERNSVPIAGSSAGAVGHWNDVPVETFTASAGSHASGTGTVVGRPTSGGAGKGRARDLLRKHYGLGVGPPQPLSGPGKPLDPMDIDSPAFDAKSYYEQLISTSTLSALLKRENQLQTEIRQLDNDRQSLVYNHHHELIAASDTISAMKTRAESIDADLDKLRDAFSEISRLNDELTTGWS